MTDDPRELPTEATPQAGGEGPPPWEPPPGPHSSATSEPRARSGVVVPVWALVTVAGVLLFGLGFLGGWLAAPGDGDSGSRGVPSANERRSLAPFFGNGNGSGTNREVGVYLGVVVESSTDPIGASIVRVAPASPASRAELERGDVITAIDDARVRNAAQLTQRVRAHDPGDRVTIAYTRGGQSKTVKVRLGDRSRLLPNGTPQSPF